MEDEKRAPVKKVVDAFGEKPDYERTYIAIEGNLGSTDEEGWTTTRITVLPANSNPAYEQRAMKSLKASCVKCAITPDTLAFTVFKPTGAAYGSGNAISGMRWDGGKWTPMGRDRTFELLSTTNLLEIANISNDVPLYYEDL